MSRKACTTHHLACGCREEKMARIVAVAKQMVGWIDGERWLSSSQAAYPVMRNALKVWEGLEEMP